MPKRALLGAFLFSLAAWSAERDDFAVCDASVVDGQALVECQVSDPDRVKRMRVRYRCQGERFYQKADFAGGAVGTQVATLAIAPCRDRPIEYYVVWQHSNGTIEFVDGSSVKPLQLMRQKEQPKQNPTTEMAQELQIYAAQDESAKERDEPLMSTRAHKISRAEIAAMGAQSLLDVLKILPGFVITRDVQGYFQVAVRGSRDDSRTQLILDGHSVYNTYSGRAFFRIPVGLIDSVEVLYGPQTTIAVKTRQLNGLVSGIKAGSFDLRSFFAGAGKQTAVTDLSFIANMETELGPKLSVQRDRYSGPSDARSMGDLLTNNQRTTMAFAVQGDVLALNDPEWHLLGHAFLLSEDRGAGIGLLDTVGPDSNLKWLLWAADLGSRLTVNEKYEFGLKFFARQHQNESLFQLTPKNFFGDTTDDSEDAPIFTAGVQEKTAYHLVDFGLDLWSQFQILAGNTAQIGATLKMVGLEPNSFSFQMNRSRLGQPQPLENLSGLTLPQNDVCMALGNQVSFLSACRFSAEVYARDEWRIIDPIQLSFGLRVTTLSDVSFVPLSQINPHVGAIFDLDSNWSLKLDFGTAFRAPTLEERLDQTPRAYADLSAGQWAGNDQLKPESIYSLESGATYRVRHGPIRLQIDTTLFLEKRENAIEKIDQTGYLTPVNNYPGYYTLGSELSVNGYFWDISQVFFNLGWFRSYWRQLDKDGDDACTLFSIFADRMPICGVVTHLPQLIANLGVHFLAKPVGHFYFSSQFGVERRNNARSALEQRRQFRIDPTAILNASFRSRPVFRYLVFHASFLNILDFHTQDDLARPDQVPGLVPREGFSIYAGIELIL